MPSHKISLLIAAVLFGAAVCGASPDRSPFLPPAAVAPQPEPVAGGIDSFELTGVMCVGDRVEVCLADRRTSRSFWIALGEPRNGLRVEDFDAAKDAVLLTAGGDARWVGLKRSRIQNLPVMRLEDGTVDWIHMNLSEPEKAKQAELMMWDILEAGRLARAGKLPRVPLTTH